MQVILTTKLKLRVQTFSFESITYFFLPEPKTYSIYEIIVDFTTKIMQSPDEPS